MAKDRQKNAYIRGTEHLSYANLSHYKRAMDTQDIGWEEYYVQSVLNKPSHANNLKREVFQKKVRNDVTNKVDPSSIIDKSNVALSNQIKSQETINNTLYSRITDVEMAPFSSFSFDPDIKVSLMYMIEEIIKVCNSDELKVLSYFIVKEKIDSIVVDDFYKNSIFDELRTYILQVWDLNVASINMLNEFIGSKSRAEVARKSLCKLIKEKFPLLTVI